MHLPTTALPGAPTLLLDPAAQAVAGQVFGRRESTSLATGSSGVLPASSGGTGISSYTVGDLLYASAATTLSKLADVATGNVLLSGGVATAPAWGKVTLTAHVSGILPVANGGTGLASGTSGGILGYTAAGTLASSGVLTANALVLGGGAGATPSVLGSLGTTTTVLHGNAAGAPTFGAVSLTADVSGTLPVANGGTGITSFGAGIATWLGTPSSANLASAITDETGTGALVFANTPTLVTPAIGAATGTSLTLSGNDSAAAFVPTGSTVPTNGLYLPAANTVSLSTNSTTRLRINSTGETLIASTTSSNAVFKLQVGDGSADTRSLFNPSNQFAISMTRSTGNGVFYLGTSAAAIPDLLFSNNGGTQVASISGAGALTVATTIQTASSGSGAGLWKLGVAVAGVGLTLNTTSYVEIDIGGTVHKLAKVN